MTNARSTSGEDEAFDDQGPRFPNAQLLRHIGLTAAPPDDEVSNDDLVHQDALHFGTDFP